jgi:hypothetical protein
MAEVVRLADHRLDPNADIIELLETLLEQAKAGEIVGIAVAYSSADRGIQTAYQYENWLLAVGAASLLHHDVLHSAAALASEE